MAHFKEKSAKARKGIGMIKQLRDYLPTNVLDQIYKMHGRSHLDYCDFIYHIPELREKKKRPENGLEDYYDENSDFDDSTEYENFEANLGSVNDMRK